MPSFRRPSDEQIREWQPRFWAKLIGLVLIAAYVIAFIIENHRNVHLHFVLFTAKVSQIWLILLSLVIGALAGALLRQVHRRRSGHWRVRPRPALVDPHGRLEAEGKPGSPGLTTEVGAAHEGDARVGRPAEQFARVDACRQLEPEEVAASGTRPAGLPAELALEGGEHRVAPFSKQPADALNVRLQHPPTS